MDTTSFTELLAADEERLRNTLRANNDLDKSREACLQTLEEEMTALLLRYNAARSGDRMRQAQADALTASVKDALGLLRAGRVEEKPAVRRLAGRAVVLLFAAICFCAAAVFLALKATPIAGYVCTLAALICAFLAGRFWFDEQEKTVRAGLDADAVWDTLRRTVETMDRKLGELKRQEEELRAEQKGSDAAADLPSEEELRLYGDLLEALYLKNGDFALRQLEHLPAYLESRGLELVSFRPENADWFLRLPSKRESATQRPALVRDGKLLMTGKATEQVEEKTAR